MRSIREIARLHFEFGLSLRDIARSVHIGASTVQEMLVRFGEQGLSWPLPAELSDTELEQMLYPREVELARPAPDWAYVHRELRRRGVTLRLLWQEHREEHPDALGYTQFCTRYREVVRHLDVTMRQFHPAGERMFVDYAGMTVPIIERASGEIREAQVFVATLGASGYTYAEATWTQDLEDFTGSQTRAFQFFGGVTRVVTPDNLKSGVTSSDYYDPEINPTYAEFARHYSVAIIPARVRRPKDKAPVERHVLVVEQAVLAPLRNVRFFTLQQANAAISPLVHKLNHRKFHVSRGCHFTKAASRWPAVAVLESVQSSPAKLRYNEEQRPVRVLVCCHVPFRIASVTVDAPDGGPSALTSCCSCALPTKQIALFKLCVGSPGS